jgi:RimJ/RimL family protein N-acetyltransferase
MFAFDDRLHGYQIAQRAGVQFNPECDRVISYSRDGVLLGGALFSNYTGASIQMHVASFDPRWLTRDALWVVFHYCFEQLGCKVVFGQVPETNSKALEFDMKLGFKEIARVDDVFPDGGLVVVAMRRKDCRWLKLKPRQLKEPAHGR